MLIMGLLTKTIWQRRRKSKRQLFSNFLVELPASFRNIISSHIIMSFCCFDIQNKTKIKIEM